MKKSKIIGELKNHIPFTALATFTAIIITIYLLRFNISEELFHVLHPLHVIASAIVTAGIFYKYKSKIFLALVIGLTGSIIIGSLSDIIFPYFGGILLGLKTTFHLSVIKSPLIIFSSAFIGSIIGISTRITKVPHFIHVFISVFASLFYLLAFSQTFNLINFIGAFFVVFIAVIIPCCLSDIVYPLLFIKRK